MLAASIEDPDPVVFYEPKAVYRAFREEVPDEHETLEIGKAQVVREGADVTLIAYGAMMRPVLEATDDLVSLHGVDVEVSDETVIAHGDEHLAEVTSQRLARVRQDLQAFFARVGAIVEQVRR